MSTAGQAAERRWPSGSDTRAEFGARVLMRSAFAEGFEAGRASAPQPTREQLIRALMDADADWSGRQRGRGPDAVRWDEHLADAVLALYPKADKS